MNCPVKAGHHMTRYKVGGPKPCRVSNRIVLAVLYSFCVFVLSDFGVIVRSQPTRFQVRVDEVVIPCTVLDSGGEYVLDLGKEDFRVIEDGVEQEIAYFAQATFPISVALLLDTSPSMKDQLPRIQKEAIRFIDQLRPNDEVMVISFDDSVRVENAFTSDRTTIYQAIRGTRCGQTTRLCDAVHRAITKELRGEPGRKALVLFSDGVDWGSRGASSSDNIRAAQRGDQIIYPLMFETLSDETGRAEKEGFANIASFERRLKKLHVLGKRYVGRLAEVSGGTVYRATGLDTLGDAFADIAADLRSLYTLGYVSTNTCRNGQFRGVKVEVKSPRFRIRHKSGYYSAQELKSDSLHRQMPDS